MTVRRAASDVRKGHGICSCCRQEMTMARKHGTTCFQTCSVEMQHPCSETSAQRVRIARGSDTIFCDEWTCSERVGDPVKQGHPMRKNV